MEDQWLSRTFQALGTAKAFGCGRSSCWVSSLSMKVAIAVLHRLCCVNQPGKLLYYTHPLVLPPEILTSGVLIDTQFGSHALRFEFCGISHRQFPNLLGPVL